MGQPANKTGRAYDGLVRIDRLVLTVADIDATVDFYTRALGMETVTFGAGQCLSGWVDHEGRSGSGRCETGISGRLNALDPGFHGVPPRDLHVRSCC